MIVEVVTRQYTAERVSAEPAVPPVDEASRSKSASPSGRLLLRMPPGLHAALGRAAEREGTSLNGYIIARLTSSVGWEPEAAEQSPARPQAAPDRRTLTWLLVVNVAAVMLAALGAVAILLVAWLG